MFDFLGNITNAGKQIEQQVVTSIQNVLNSLSSAVQNSIVNPISADISRVLGSIGQGVSGLESAAAHGIQSTINTVGEALSATEQSAANGISNALNTVSGGLNTITTGIEGALDTVVKGISEGFKSIVYGVQSTLNGVGGAIHDSIITLGSILQASFTPIFNTIAGFIEQLPADIQIIAKDIGAGVERFATGTEDIAKNVAEFIKSRAAMGIADVQSALDPKTWIGPRQLFGNTFFTLIGEITGLDISKADPIALARLAAGLAGEFAIATAVPFDEGLAFMVGRQLPAILDIAMAGSWRDLEQMSNSATPNVLLSLSEIIEARFRGEVDDAYFYDQTERRGISDANADILYNIGQQLLGGAELIELWYRGFYTSKDLLYADAKKIRLGPQQIEQLIVLRQTLIGLGESVTMWRRGIVPEGWHDSFDDARKGGMTEERIKAVKDSSYALPQIAEFHRFARQQVDDPAVVDKFKYDYLITDEYLALAKAHGFDEKTARRMWRAGWAIPPFFITESLYRTGEMNEETFRYFLKQEGYTPPVQDMLIEQLKPKLKQSDIKDAYKYQVITEGEIVPRLTAIGVPQDVARDLHDIWVASVKRASPLDQSVSESDRARVIGETEGLIKEAYIDGVLGKNDALTQLKELGKSNEAASLILLIADHTMTQKKIKALAQHLKDGYLAGDITIGDAMQSYIQMGASNDQVVLLQDELTKAGRSKPKVPTLQEFGAWHKKGIITDAQLAAGISLLGYSDTWIPFYLAYFGVSATVIEQLGFSLSLPVLA